MSRTDRHAHPGLGAMHLAVLDGIDGFDVIRPAASVDVTPMMDVLRRGPVERFVNEAVDLPEPPAHANMPVAVTVLRASPNPAAFNGSKVAIEAGEAFVGEHPRSIQASGFNASGLDAKRDSAVPTGCAQ